MCGRGSGGAGLLLTSSPLADGYVGAAHLQLAAVQGGFRPADNHPAGAAGPPVHETAGRDLAYRVILLRLPAP